MPHKKRITFAHRMRPAHQRRLALWKAVVGVAAGAAIACGALLIWTYGPLSFDAWPKTLAITLVLGSLGSLYALSKLGTVIVVLRELWLARAQKAVAADRAKPRSG